MRTHTSIIDVKSEKSPAGKVVRSLLFRYLFNTKGAHCRWKDDGQQGIREYN